MVQENEPRGSHAVRCAEPQEASQGDGEARAAHRAEKSSFVPASHAAPQDGSVHGRRPGSPGSANAAGINSGHDAGAAASGPGPAYRPASAPRSGPAPQRSRNGRKAALVAGCTAVAVLAVVYLAGAFTFMDRFMPRTTVMGEDVSFKTSAEVQDLLADIAKSYALDVSGQGFSLKLTSADMGTGINVQSVTDAMHADANPWAWPVEVFGSRDETDKLATSNGKLEQAVRTAVDAFNEGAVPPRNAGLDYDAGSSSFVVRTETAGTALDADRVLAAVSAAVASLEPSMTLGEDALQKPTLFADDTRLAKAADDANDLLKADFNLKLADTVVARVNADQIADWMRLGDDVTVGVDESLVAAWVQDIASACNTYQARRTFTRADGKEVTVSGGVYGWIVDKDQLKKTVMDGVRSAQAGDVAIPCEQEAGAYDGLHDADWQPAFGGSRYASGFGSHGCVNLPVEKATALYDLIATGDVVVCHW